MTPHNLWMESGPVPGSKVIHRLPAGAGRVVPSRERMQVPEAKNEIRLYRFRDASYQLLTS